MILLQAISKSEIEDHMIENTKKEKRSLAAIRAHLPQNAFSSARDSYLAWYASNRFRAVRVLACAAACSSALCKKMPAKNRCGAL